MTDPNSEPATNPTSDANAQPIESNPKGPVIRVPIPPARDPLDPLDPVRLAGEELTVRQLLQEADRIITTVRPEYFREYRSLIGQLAANYRLYRNDTAWAAYDYDRAYQYMKDVASLPLSGIDSVQLRDSARKAVGESWRLWWSVYTTFKQCAEHYAVLSVTNQDLVVEVPHPSTAPPVIL